ncbi:MAG: AI-2E family transporter [Anaerolineales bacterium]
MSTPPVTTSPRWGATTKLVVALTIVTIIAAALVKFQNIIPPLIMAFLFVYLFYPAASFLSRKLRLGWGLAVGIVYIILLILLIGLIALGGYELIQQFQSLLVLVESSLKEIPELTEQLSNQVFRFGPLTLDMRTLDLNSLVGQLLNSVQPLLGQTGTLLGRVASGAFNILGWTLFTLIVSFFILFESKGLPQGILNIQVPVYHDDLRQMGERLGRIWNAFLRGQLILFATSTVIYSIVLSLLGVRYAIGLAILAGLARFLPYIGPAITWMVYALVAFFQPYHMLGTTPFIYMLIVLVISWIIDGILDNIVSPRIMANALKVHPAAVLVAAIIALDLLGILGVIIAAPILATSKLIGEYVIRKLFDLDPWEASDEMPQPPPLREQIRGWLDKTRQIFRLRR